MATATDTTLGTIALMGDLAGGSNATLPSLTPTGVIPGEFFAPSIVIDTKGRILYGRSINEYDVPCAASDQCGTVKIGNNITTTTVDERTEISLKKASATEYGAVKLGNGFTRDCCEIFLDYPIATTAIRGTVIVPNGSNVVVDGAGNLSIPLATAGVSGLLTVPTANGLSITAGVVNFVSPKSADATTSSQGFVQVGTNLSVDGTGILSIPNASSSVPGVARGDATFGHSSGVLSQATIATGSVLGLVKAGSGTSVDGSGLLSVASANDATTSTKGTVRVAAGDPILSISGGVVSSTGTLATTGAVGLARPGTNIAFDSGTATISIPVSNPGTSTVGIASTSSTWLTLVNGALDLSSSILQASNQNTYTKAQISALVSANISGTYFIDFSQSNVFALTLTGGVSLMPSNFAEGGQYIVIVKQNSSGSNTLTYSSDFKFAGSPLISTTPNSVSLITINVVDSKLFCQVERNFS